MRLVLPSVKYKKSYLKAVEEGQGESGPAVLRKPKEGESAEFWLVDRGEFIGKVLINKKDGHVSYYVRVSKRGQGYGKKILKIALKKAKVLGIEKALITCDLNNIPSAKVIEANGGVLESIVSAGKNLPKKKRYWIKIS